MNLDEWAALRRRMRPFPELFRFDDQWLAACLPTNELRNEYLKKVHWRMTLIGTEGAGMFNHQVLVLRVCACVHPAFVLCLCCSLTNVYFVFILEYFAFSIWFTFRLKSLLNQWSLFPLIVAYFILYFSAFLIYTQIPSPSASTHRVYSPHPTQSHQDVLRTGSWQVQLSGAKLWHICAPSESRWLYGEGSSPIDVFQPDYAKYPLFANADCFGAPLFQMSVD